MARRRLLTILAASAVLSASLAGPAVALDLVEETTSATGEVVAEVEEVGDDVTDPIDAVVEDTAVEEPVGEVTEAVDETVEQLPTSTPPPEPEPEPEQEQEPRTRTEAAGPSSAAADTEDGTRADVVAAGDVEDAPGLEAGSARGTLWPMPDGASPALPAPMTAPDPADADAVEAPLVAPPPASDAPASPSVLALPATTPTPDESSPILVLVAVASLLAAGAWTLGEARATASVTAIGSVSG